MINVCRFWTREGTVVILRPETEETNASLEQGKVDFDYVGRNRAYRIKLTHVKEYHGNRELIISLIKSSMELRNVIVE